jgi:hypothetical protein
MQVIASLSSADRWRLITELTKGARMPAAGPQPPVTAAPATVTLGEQLNRKRLPLGLISAAPAEAGHVNERGQPYNAQSIRAMLRGPQKRERRGLKPR